MKKIEISKQTIKTDFIFAFKYNKKYFVAKIDKISKKKFVKEVFKKVKNPNYKLDYFVKETNWFEINFNVEVEFLVKEFSFETLNFEIKTKKINMDFESDLSDNFLRDYLIVFRLEHPDTFIKSVEMFEKKPKFI